MDCVTEIGRVVLNSQRESHPRVDLGNESAMDTDRSCSELAVRWTMDGHPVIKRAEERDIVVRLVVAWGTRMNLAQLFVVIFQACQSGEYLITSLNFFDIPRAGNTIGQ